MFTATGEKLISCLCLTAFLHQHSDIRLNEILYKCSEYIPVPLCLIVGVQEYFPIFTYKEKYPVGPNNIYFLLI